MTPGHENIVKLTVWFIDPIFSTKKKKTNHNVSKQTHKQALVHYTIVIGLNFVLTARGCIFKAMKAFDPKILL